MKDLDRIARGDIVRVYFGRLAMIPKAEVLYMPQGPGDSWILRECDTGDLRYVQQYNTIDLISKRVDPVLPEAPPS